MEIKITSPNMIDKFYRWEVGEMKGKANSEPEAWRLALDAKKLQIKKPPKIITGGSKMKLIITHPKHGHLELTTKEDIKTEFEKIMKEGYGNKIPAVFHTEMKDGSSQVVKGKDAENLIDNPNVKEITVLAPLAGG